MTGYDPREHVSTFRAKPDRALVDRAATVTPPASRPPIVVPEPAPSAGSEPDTTTGPGAPGVQSQDRRVTIAVAQPDDLSKKFSASAANMNQTLGELALDAINRHWEAVRDALAEQTSVAPAGPIPRVYQPRQYRRVGGSRRRDVRMSIVERDAVVRLSNELGLDSMSDLVRRCLEIELGS